MRHVLWACVLSVAVFGAYRLGLDHAGRLGRLLEGPGPAAELVRGQGYECARVVDVAMARKGRWGWLRLHPPAVRYRCRIGEGAYCDYVVESSRLKARMVQAGNGSRTWDGVKLEGDGEIAGQCLARGEDE